MEEFSHYSSDGTSKMVDVSEKDITRRTARACGFVSMSPETLELIERRLLPKGDLFEVARIAGILAAKRTAELIPMCHPLSLSYVDLGIEIKKEKGGIEVTSEIRLHGKTGAEMEALTAVSVAALTIYDMCKAVDKCMVIGEIQVVEKKGGKSDISAGEKRV
ncbi:MAG: cyclic pyranopterin monophosphate synthase MoaC [Spirochaetae bacterium HGW-Spirochaetae-1]|nr:MAG: cyclic pyranopterin monophosphate synthase MoaC [Spirochaetae bacterium HGW-Spirochaetae-1]